MPQEKPNDARRKEHASKVLSERKPRWNELPKEEFLFTPKFYPIAPRIYDGLFFEKVNMITSFDEIAKYRMSTMEKNWIWKPTFAMDAIVRKDLIDKDAIIAAAKTKSVLDVADARLLSNDRRSTKDSEQKNIPWLLRTTYLVNNLNDNVNKFKGDEELEKGFYANKRKQIGSSVDIFSTEAIELSFDAIANKMQALERENQKSAGKKIEWSLPIVPNMDIWPQALTMAHYEGDILPEVPAGKRRRFDESILGNIRSLETKETTVKTHSFAVSMSVPEEIDEEDMFADDDEKTYVWCKDYRMDVKNSHLDDYYHLIVDTDNGNVYFAPLRSRIEMKKLNVNLSQPHAVVVQRRDFSEAEVSQREALVEEIK